MSGEHTGEHDYNTFLVEIEQKFAILKKIDPSNRKYKVIWKAVLSQFMQLLDAAKKTSSHKFLQDNIDKIINMSNTVSATITESKLKSLNNEDAENYQEKVELALENTVLAKKLRDAFLEAAENIATTNPILGITLFENALKTAVQIQDPTWHSDPTRAKTIRDLHHKLSSNYSKQQQTEINNIMDTYLPTRTRQNIRFARQFAKAQDEYAQESSSRESRNSPPQQSELEKQRFIMLNLTKLMRQSNDYSMRNTLKPSSLVAPPLTMISDFESILQTCLKLQNYQKFILEQLEYMIQINDFLVSHFNSIRTSNAATSMQTIHNLMRQIISVAAAEEASHSVPRNHGKGTTEREDRSSRGNPPKTTPYNNITKYIDKILDAIISYNEVQGQLADSVKKTQMLAILSYFNNALTMYIENGSITQEDYKKINVIRDVIADIDQINKLNLVLQKTEGLMLRIDSIFKPSSSSSKRWWS